MHEQGHRPSHKATEMTWHRGAWPHSPLIRSSNGGMGHALCQRSGRWSVGVTGPPTPCVRLMIRDPPPSRAPKRPHTPVTYPPLPPRRSGGLGLGLDKVMSGTDPSRGALHWPSADPPFAPPQGPLQSGKRGLLRSLRKPRPTEGGGGGRGGSGVLGSKNKRKENGFGTPTETNVHGDALCCVVKTRARHKATETVLNNGWRLAAVGRWRLVAVGGWRLVAVGGGWRGSDICGTRPREGRRGCRTGASRPRRAVTGTLSASWSRHGQGTTPQKRR